MLFARVFICLCDVMFVCVVVCFRVLKLKCAQNLYIFSLYFRLDFLFLFLPFVVCTL